MILFDALYINNSGGKVLLDVLVKTLHASGIPVFYLFDSRIEGEYYYLPKEHTYFMEAGLLRRHRFYSKHGSRFKAVLCFANLPPSIKMNVPVFTYFHNVLYLDFPKEASGFKYLEFYLKRLVLRNLSSNTTEWWVQIPSVARLLEQVIRVKSSSIRQMPFYAVALSETAQVIRENYSFLYVSDANPHKNHARLLKAFEQVHREFPQSRLYLTVGPGYPETRQLIARYKNSGVAVENLGLLPAQILVQQYRSRGCLVFPSLRESFGLGLVEAASLGMPVICSRLPFAEEVIQPSLLFNPHDIQSMADAMKRFLKEGLPPAQVAVSNSLSAIVDRLKECL